MQVSNAGVAFIAAHEGVVLKAYRDPVGIVTIGTGFTMRSGTFAAWARQKWRGGLKMGVSITRAENDQLLKTLLNEEYGRAVNIALPDLRQHQHDAAASTTFNCGPGTLKDKWAVAMGKGLVAEAARLLKTTRVTAAGKRLAGLVRRRHEEARLLEHADYGSAINAGTAAAPSVSTTPEAVAAYQKQLSILGYFSGSIDGSQSVALDEAVKKFQRDQKLTVDGIVGKATRSALQRAVSANASTKVAAGGGGVVAVGEGGIDAVTSGPAGMDWSSFGWALGFGVMAIGTIVLLAFAWRYRGAIAMKLGIKGWPAKRLA